MPFPPLPPGQRLLWVFPWVLQPTWVSFRVVLKSMIAKNGLHGRAHMTKPRRQPSAKLELQKRIGGFLQVGAVTIPPGLLHSRQAVHVQILQMDHFEQSRFAVRASPTAQARAAVRS